MNRLHLSFLRNRSLRSALASVLVAPLLLGGAIALPLVLPQEAQAAPGSELIIKRTLQMGDRGADVLQLQRALVSRGLLRVSIPPSQREGYFGPTTQAALKAFQRSERDLVADGVLGEQTFRRLFGVGAISSKRFSLGVMQLQLRELGYYRGSLDGKFGPTTARALQDLRDEVFVNVSSREDRLEETFDAVNRYYSERRLVEDLPPRSALEARVKEQLPAESLLGYYGEPPRAVGMWNGQGGPTSDRPWMDRPTYQTNDASQFPYVVMIPMGKDPELVWDVRKFVADAFLQADRRGDYVQVGVYGDRANADQRANSLKNNGFDARVIYSD